MNRKRVSIIFAKGCPRSMMDAAKLVDYFKANEWDVTRQFKDAGMIVLFLCGFSSYVDFESSKILSKIRKQNKDALIVLAGCYSYFYDQTKEKAYLVVKKRDFSFFDDLIKARVPFMTVPEPNVLSDYEAYLGGYLGKSYQFYLTALNYVKQRVPVFTTDFLCLAVKKLLSRSSKSANPTETVFSIRVAKGCDSGCSYCAIKNAVGGIVSKDIEAIARELEKGLARGYNTINLIAEDVGAYGQDSGSNVVALLDLLTSQRGNYKISFEDFHPKWFMRYPEVEELFLSRADKFGSIGFPIQSGSDRILALMKREYSIEDISAPILNIKKANPNLFIATHMLVGFPGETEEDFEASVELLRKIPFDEVFRYKYTDRPNTPASQLPGKVSERVKSERSVRLALVRDKR